jgi:hypothetical protein
MKSLSSKIKSFICQRTYLQIIEDNKNKVKQAEQKRTSSELHLIDDDRGHYA